MCNVAITFPDDRKASEKAPQLLNFLKLYFDYAYFFCLSPFRFRWDKEMGRALVIQWFPQKILCALAHLISIIILIRDLQANILQSSTTYFRNPVKYFQLIDSVFNFVYKATLIKRLWLNRVEFVRLVDFIQIRKSLQNTTTKLQRPIFIHALLVLYTMVSLLSFVAGKNFVSGVAEWSAEWWLRRLVVFARYVFYIDHATNLKKGAPPLSEIKVWEIFLAAVMVFGLITRFLIGYFIDLYIFLSTMTLWAVTRSFSNSIRFNPYEKWMTITTTASNARPISFATVAGIHAKIFDFGSTLKKKEKSDSARWPKIHESFQTIRILAHLINKTFGSLVVWFILEGMMYYSVNMDAFLITKDHFKRITLLAYYLGTIGIYAFASEVCKELEETKAWVSEDDNRAMVPNEDLNLVLHEMLAKDIGIRGWGVFTITYPLFASIVGTIVTFFIICVEQSTNS